MSHKCQNQEKIPNLLQCVTEHLKSGKYRFTNHALIRKNERSIPIPDILHVLQTGFHEKIKDQWDETYKAWNYSIRGKTIDGEDLRIIVSFDEYLQIITVIRIER